MTEQHLSRSDDEKRDLNYPRLGRTVLNPIVATTHEGILSAFGDSDDKNNLKIHIIGTQEVKGRIFKHISYTIQSNVNEKYMIVSRRYNDFRWLHSALSIEYFCIFIPPIPPPNNMRNILKRFDKEFISRRRYDLQRFLNRIFSNKMLAKSDSFQQFLTQQCYVRFVEQQTVIKNRLLSRTDQQVSDFITNECFSHIDFVDNDDDEGKDEYDHNEERKKKKDTEIYLEQIPRIREVFMRCDETFVKLNKMSRNIYEIMTQMVLDINKINEALYGLYDIEKKEKPENIKHKTHKRTEANAFMNKWRQCQQHQMYCYYKYFLLTLKYEHMDCLAVLDIFVRYDIAYNKYKRLVNQTKKYEEYDIEVRNELKVKDIKCLLDVVCAIILKEQIPKLWTDKVVRFNEQMLHFQSRISEYTLNDS